MHTYNHEAIARYITGEMSGAELQAFEATLQQDISLQESVAQYREVLDTLQYKLEPDEKQQALSQTLRAMNEEYFRDNKVKVMPMRHYWKYISGIAAAAIVFFIIWLQPWQQDLYKEYGQIQMVAAAERGTDTDTLLQEAAVLFNRGDLVGAQKYLREATAQAPENQLTAFYYAVTLIATHDLTQARQLLTTIYNGSSVVKYDAAFFMALSYLKEKQYEDTRSWLEKIPAGTSRYAAAQELLRKI